MKNLVVFALLFGFVGMSFTTLKLVNSKIDLQKSSLTWKGGKVVGGSHEGTIKIKSGDIESKGGKLTGGSFEIDLTTLEVTDIQGGGKTKLEGHLKSDDFFSVEKHPTAKIALKKVKSTGKDTYDIDGDLTIKGKTHPVSFKATQSTTAEGTTLFNANITVDRSKYDVRYGSKSFFDGLGDNVIKDDFQVFVSLVLKEKI